MSAPIRERFRIAADHPVLSGHFPGKPVVPGVVLLDRVAAAVEREWGLRLSGLPQVKFLRPLRPDEEAELLIERQAGGVRFRCVVGSTAIASGVLVVIA